jgi:pimeloyl-ACP methyl ester carboxylesterase
MQIAHHRLAVPDATLHYTVSGEGPPLVLIHGFPQTWHQWRPVMERLAGRFRIIAPDLRGIGATPGPATGYDKLTMAGDIRAIMDKEVGDAPATIVGHDMGAFVAFAHGLLHPERTRALVLVDAPMSGTTLFDQLRTHPRAWHIAFHGARDIAEMLVAGRERAYIAQFVAARIYDSSAVTAEDIDVYAAAYSAPGALRAGFEMYRAFDVDVAQHRELLARGKLRMPVAMVGGEASLSGTLLADSMAEFAEDGRAYSVERAAHWIPEEQPDRMAKIITETAAR